VHPKVKGQNEPYVHVIVIDLVVGDVVGDVVVDFIVNLVIDLVVDLAVVLVSLLDGLLVVRRLAYTQRRAYAAHRSSKRQLMRRSSRRFEREETDSSCEILYERVEYGVALNRRPTRTMSRKYPKTSRINREAQPGKFVRELHVKERREFGKSRRRTSAIRLLLRFP